MKSKVRIATASVAPCDYKQDHERAHMRSNETELSHRSGSEAAQQFRIH